MPKARVVRDPELWEAYFQDQFAWDGGNDHPHWALAAGRHVGFLAFQVSDDREWAAVNHNVTWFLRSGARAMERPWSSGYSPAWTTSASNVSI